MSKLTAVGRHHVKRKNWALPRRPGDLPSVEGHYYIGDRTHARNALSRANQRKSHLTAAEKQTIRRKVHARYPGIHVSGLKRRKK